MVRDIEGEERRADERMEAKKASETSSELMTKESKDEHPNCRSELVSGPQDAASSAA
ncbi:MAG: hypothetical protein IJ689_03070 [Alphaproteobacteria bacterium]|nr:hypothetical protein [Alphaproteobacteria bacterium]